MALFGLGKKKNEKAKKSACTCNSSRTISETAETEKVTNCCSETKKGIYCVKVLGSGCASCHTLYENTQTAIEIMELHVKAEYITDLKTVMEYGVMSMPALVVNDKVLSMGKVLKARDIQKLLETSGI